MNSITYGEISFDDMYSLIKKFILEDFKASYRIAIGADSQNFGYTKVPVTIGVHRFINDCGRGGIFFSEIRKVKKISSIRQKLYYETNLSLEYALKLRENFEKDKIPQNITVHVDAGYNGPTSQLIAEVIGLVNSCGFPCLIKPDSYMASTVANRLSK